MIRVVPIPTYLWPSKKNKQKKTNKKTTYMAGWKYIEGDGRGKVEHGKFHLCQFNFAIVPLPPPTSLPYQGKLELEMEMVSEEEEQLVPEGKSPT